MIRDRPGGGFYRVSNHDDATVRVAVSLVVAVLLALAVWATPRVSLWWLVAVTVATAAVIVGGAAFGWGLYPWSDAVVLAFGLFGGVLLGPAYPRSLRSFFILLAVLSALDIAQNFAFSGPPPASSAPGGGPNPHFIWLNFRVPLPSGHLNLGFADLVLIAAMTEQLRRHEARIWLSALPGVLGLLLAELVFALHEPVGTVDTAVEQSLIPYLTIGWLVAVATAPVLRSRLRQEDIRHLRDASASGP